MARIRLLLIADDPLSRAGLAAHVAAEPRLALEGQGALAEAPALLAANAADVLCWDPGPDADGADGLVAAAGDRPVLALLGAGASGAALLRAGVRALVDRGAPGETLRAALLAAARGLTVLSPGLAAAWLRPTGAEPPEGRDALTPREREVMALLAEGMGNKAIAARLGISEHTAKFHVNAILGKLGAERRAEAIVIAARRGLVAL